VKLLDYFNMVKSVRTKQMVNRLAKALGPKVVPQKKQKRRVKNRAPLPVFGPVATIDTAPVSIGSSITGATPVIIPIEDGQRIQGRDFLIGVDATASTIVDWTLVGGSPVAPGCMVASTLKHFSSTYAHYMIHGVAFHFITSSSTATNGSVMFYVNKDRSRPALPTDSANFMSAVLSDHHTVIGPLWKNTTASYFPEPVWFSTDVFDGEQMLSQCPGELLMYTKSANNEIPGYIVVDYDISFRGLSLNPKTGVLPISRMKYTQVALTATALVVVQNSTTVAFVLNSGLLLDGGTTSTAPSGTAEGDIFKIVMNEDDATFTNTSAALSLSVIYSGGGTTPVTITDGFTCYGVCTSDNVLVLFPNYAAAQNGDAPFRWGVTATVTVKIPAFISLCGAVSGTLTQANI
jgi:hypothetical protein